MIGSFLTGCFADSSVSLLDGVTDAPGAINGNGIQVAKQLAEIAAISGWSFSISLLILIIMKYIPGLHLRVSEEAELMGLDLDQFFDEQIGDWSAVEMAHGIIDPVKMDTEAFAQSRKEAEAAGAMTPESSSKEGQEIGIKQA